MELRRIAVLVAVVATFLCVSVEAGGQKNGDAGEVEVRLAEGRIGAYGWHMLVRRARTPKIRSNPCIGVALGRVRDLEGGSWPPQIVCGAVKPVPTVIGYSIGSGSREKAVLAVAVDLSVDLVAVDTGSRGQRLYSPKVLTVIQSHRARTERFGYVGAGFSGHICIKQIQTYNAKMRLTWRSPRMECQH
jgi:hypothetical protein